MDSLTCFFTFLVLTNFSIIVLGKEENWWEEQNWCYENGNYTTNSTYHNNLKTLLSSLSSNIGNSGFYEAALGQKPDQVYATAFCRGDTQLRDCRTCVQNASAEILNICPNRKQASKWHHPCMVRYSDETVVGRREDGGIQTSSYAENVTSPVEFDRVLKTLFDELRSEAISGGSLMKIGVGNKTGPDLTTIFSLLQCTPDLSKQECEACLLKCQGWLAWCCPYTFGVYIVVPSCYFEFEVEPFYNLSRIQEVQRMLSISVPPGPVPEPQVPLTSGKKDNITGRTIVIVVAPIISSLVLLAFFGVWLTKRRKKKLEETPAYDKVISTSESLLRHEFYEIRDATNNFSDVNKLGEGGFGAVYKGELQNSQKIAVKRLFKGSTQGDTEFQNEVILLAKLQHRNLVRLVGFAIEGIERILIYEFIQNGSLDHFIFDPTKAQYIGWNNRFKIIQGIAKGLLYLHEDSQLRVVHLDLKASNILLDENMNPKIGDFGMARLYEHDQSEVNTQRIAGTYGYMAPEYVMHGQFSIKSDTFSFGILLLEIISGQKN